MKQLFKFEGDIRQRDETYLRDTLYIVAETQEQAELDLNTRKIVNFVFVGVEGLSSHW